MFKSDFRTKTCSELNGETLDNLLEPISGSLSTSYYVGHRVYEKTYWTNIWNDGH